ncbi:MAG: OprO/OprP family phosphate-selective porin [Deltaproteobacteria bacterium]|jgi:hypothetical protein|nr:OprO/OprP family phosphate-selective porin [Deltaproteobacteria bacterium]
MKKIITKLFICFVGLFFVNLTCFLYPNGLRAEEPNIYYQRGAKLAIPSAGFELKLRTELASYYSFTNYSAFKTRTTNSIQPDSKNSFDIQRANIITAGNVADKRFSYFIKYEAIKTNLGIYGDLFNSADPEHSGKLSETWGQWNAPNNYAKLRVGKQKIPLGLQRAMQDTELQFVTPALSNQVMFGVFDTNLNEKNKIITLEDKNTGIMGQSVTPYKNLLISWTTGIFNQEPGTNSNTNVLGLLGVNLVSNDYDRTVEGDRQYSQALAWTAGISATVTRLNLERRTVDVLNGALDFGLKYRGFSWQSEGLINYANAGRHGDAVNLGYYTQFGYFIVPQLQELAIRFSGIDFDKGFSQKAGFEYSLVYNYYLVGEFLKFQAGLAYYDLKMSLANSEKYQVFKGLVGVSGVF